MGVVEVSAVRIIGFDTGHRVVGHEGKCRTNHGHRYAAHLYARPKSGLDNLGRVVDFSVLKEKIGGWIDLHWDHNMVIWKDDPNLLALKTCEALKPIFVLDTNPTAENMAEYLLTEICPDLMKDYDIEVHSIRLYETPNCYVEVNL